MFQLANRSDPISKKTKFPFYLWVVLISRRSYLDSKHLRRRKTSTLFFLKKKKITSFKGTTYEEKRTGCKVENAVHSSFPSCTQRPIAVCQETSGRSCACIRQIVCSIQHCSQVSTVSRANPEQSDTHKQLRSLSMANGNTPEWQQEAPYKLVENDAAFKVKYTASCMCGEVQYAADSDPVSAKYCHCTDCQHLHGETVSQFICLQLSVECMPFVSDHFVVQVLHFSGQHCSKRMHSDLSRVQTASCFTIQLTARSSTIFPAKLAVPNVIHLWQMRAEICGWHSQLSLNLTATKHQRHFKVTVTSSTNQGVQT